MRLSPRLALVAVALAAPAYAHIQLVYPPPRDGNLKVGPCGGVGRSETVTTLPAGATITVVFDETVDHQGYYRIAFDGDGEDDLGSPYLDGASWTNPPGVLVLADQIPNAEIGLTHGEVAVQLPDVPCTSCTLQLIQVMSESGTLYFACADLVLEEAAPVCGNGVVEAGEACDDGNASDDDACLVTCVAASCGDGHVQAGVESCDDGNSSDDDACLSTCVAPAPPPASGGGCGSPGAGALALALAGGALAVRRRRARA